MDHYPVVHIALEDAIAYADWKDQRLPTEAEYEYVSRGGADGQTYAWGEELTPEGKYLARSFPLFAKPDPKRYQGCGPKSSLLGSYTDCGDSNHNTTDS